MIRRFTPITGIAVCVALSAGAVSAGARAPASASVQPLAASSRLDYSKDAFGRLRRLNPSFIAQTLGLAPITPSAAASSAGLTVSFGPVNTAAAPQGPVVSSATSPCVNGHQTADPLSPPCVASFTGPNGGATYPGVTGDEIRLLVAINIADYAGPSTHPSEEITYDLGRPPTPDETANMPWMQRLRSLQAYFNSHYQTYGRRVHFFGRNITAAGDVNNRNEALLDAILVHPFAVLISGRWVDFPSSYAEELAYLGIPSFDMGGLNPDAHYVARPGLLWAYRPAAEQAADLFGSYLCQKVVERPVVMSGNPGESGHSRRLGLLRGFADVPAYHHFADLIQQKVAGCGGTIADREDYREPNGCNSVVEDESGGGSGTDSARAVAAFKAHGVTTIIWPGCGGYRVARAAEAIGYFPEWVLWGAGRLDTNTVATVSAWPGPIWDHHAIVVTPATLRPPTALRLCYQALRLEDPSTPDDGATAAACDYYEGLRQVFTNFQLAGPYLTPGAMDLGVRRFVPVANDPQTPRCFYPEGDYSCVKDAQAEWWDSGGGSHPTGGFFGIRGAGCWRSIEGGRRYEAGQWPGGNIDAQITGREPCNLHGEHEAPT